MSRHFLGHLDEFKSGIENITTYLERVDLFLLLIKCPTTRKLQFYSAALVRKLIQH